jgi:hypothetical protein
MAVPHSVGALHEYRADLVRDLGGEASLSTAELHLVDLAVRDKLLLDSLDAALAERPLLNRKRGRVVPALEARFRMADSATRRLQALGLKRRTRRKTVQEIIAEIQREAEITSATQDDGNDGGDDETDPSRKIAGIVEGRLRGLRCRRPRRRSWP